MNDQELDDFERSLRALHAAAHTDVAESIDVSEELMSFKKRAYAEAATAISAPEGAVPPERAALVATTELLLRMSMTDDRGMPKYAYRDVVRVVSGRRPSLRKLVSVAGMAGLFSGMAAATTALVAVDHVDVAWVALLTGAVLLLMLVSQMWLATMVAKTDTFTVRLRCRHMELALSKSPRGSNATTQGGSHTPVRSAPAVADAQPIGLADWSPQLAPDRWRLPLAGGGVGVRGHGSAGPLEAA